MRTWGRIPDPASVTEPLTTPNDVIMTNPDASFVTGPSGLMTGNLLWTQVSTDSNGFNDEVWLTTLVQTCKLNLGESPFFADRGIPAHQSIMQQIAPDYYVQYIQQLFAPYFASLQVAKTASYPPTYAISVTTKQGFKVFTQIPVPT